MPNYFGKISHKIKFRLFTSGESRISAKTVMEGGNPVILIAKMSKYHEKFVQCIYAHNQLINFRDFVFLIFNKTMYQNIVTTIQSRQCDPWLIRIFCLIRTIVIHIIVCFPIDFKVWIMHTFCLIRTKCSHLFVRIIRASLYFLIFESASLSYSNKQLSPKSKCRGTFIYYLTDRYKYAHVIR